ncbi:hypothetical protein 4 [Hubei myriapoda virus 3]|uniref:hypothetical protein 4 n=1 Tax=Hubei myriapoda virus 3 TaxID=1922932 RepID=UPI00090A5397|nr:hypothetical protein 4 [Hubei myriapoda virus 3]APG77512.1 hypothetical protein 4 [Hubei myriapoda virus 3]
MPFLYKIESLIQLLDFIEDQFQVDFELGNSIYYLLQFPKPWKPHTNEPWFLYYCDIYEHFKRTIENDPQHLHPDLGVTIDFLPDPESFVAGATNSKLFVYKYQKNPRKKTNLLAHTLNCVCEDCKYSEQLALALDRKDRLVSAIKRKTDHNGQLLQRPKFGQKKIQNYIRNSGSEDLFRQHTSGCSANQLYSSLAKYTKPTVEITSPTRDMLDFRFKEVQRKKETLSDELISKLAIALTSTGLPDAIPKILRQLKVPEGKIDQLAYDNQTVPPDVTPKNKTQSLPL